MPALRLALGCLLILILANGSGHAAARMAAAESGVTDDAERLEPWRTSVAGDGADGADGAAPAIPRLHSSTSACSAALMALLPPPEDLEQSGNGVGEVGEVTGRGCRSLNELAATFANPEQAALDLSAWGWVETVYQSYSDGYDHGTRISIQRFATPEGAAQALDAFASTANEPAGTVAIESSHVQPHQRALQSRQWRALIEQDGVLLTLRRSDDISRCSSNGARLRREIARPSLEPCVFGTNVLRRMLPFWSTRCATDAGDGWMRSVRVATVLARGSGQPIPASIGERLMMGRSR
jgi:hypothetical protein